jgi:hypothetical protein
VLCVLAGPIGGGVCEYDLFNALFKFKTVMVKRFLSLDVIEFLTRVAKGLLVLFAIFWVLGKDKIAGGSELLLDDTTVQGNL